MYILSSNYTRKREKKYIQRAKKSGRRAQNRAKKAPKAYAIGVHHHLIGGTGCRFHSSEEAAILNGTLNSRLPHTILRVASLALAPVSNSLSSSKVRVS